MDEVFEAAAPFLDEVGFPWTSTISVKMREQAVYTIPPVIRYPKIWADHYFGEHLMRDDRIARHSVTGFAPLTWEEVLSRDDLSPKERDLYDEAESVGLTNGMVVPIRLLNHETGAVFFTGEGEFTPEIRAITNLVAIFLYESVRRLSPEIDRQPRQFDHIASKALTGREAECLRWILNGKSNAVIADILGISTHTVHFHVENAKHKLGVATRTQAVVKALVSNQIQL